MEGSYKFRKSLAPPVYTSFVNTLDSFLAVALGTFFQPEQKKVKFTVNEPVRGAARGAVTGYCVFLMLAGLLG